MRFRLQPQETPSPECPFMPQHKEWKWWAYLTELQLVLNLNYSLLRAVSHRKFTSWALLCNQPSWGLFWIWKRKTFVLGNPQSQTNQDNWSPYRLIWDVLTSEQPSSHNGRLVEASLRVAWSLLGVTLCLLGVAVNCILWSKHGFTADSHNHRKPWGLPCVSEVDATGDVRSQIQAPSLFGTLWSSPVHSRRWNLLNILAPYLHSTVFSSSTVLTEFVLLSLVVSSSNHVSNKVSTWSMKWERGKKRLLFSKEEVTSALRTAVRDSNDPLISFCFLASQFTELPTMLQLLKFQNLSKIRCLLSVKVLQQSGAKVSL